MKPLLFSIICVLISGVFVAQDLSNKLDNAAYQVDKTANSVKNTTKTAGVILDLGKNLFGGKKKKITSQENLTPESTTANTSENVYQMTMKGIDNENPLFGQICTKVKTFKGVSSTQKFLEGSEGIISFNFTGDISEIWDSLKDKTKQNFKVEKITENHIRVVYKK